jgi:23S rRNA (uracil1939-C5)-methyltransferase
MKIDIFDISAEGEGIGRLDGKVVFVPGAVIGETVEAEIVEDKERFAKARRVDRDVERECGGCPLLDMDYSVQLAWKESRVRSCLTRIAGLDEPLVRPIIGMEAPFHYRNKAEFVVENGRVGYYAGKTHDFVSFRDCRCGGACRIQSEEALRIAEEFEAAPTKNAERLIVRTAVSGEAMAYTIQTSGYMLLYRGKKILKDVIKTDLGELKVEVDPLSFYQVNPAQTSRLYSKVQEYAALSGSETVLDLYCGAGSIGLSVASKAARVIGVESVKPAVILANRNAVINGIVNATFVCGKAEEAVAEKLQGIKADVVVLDPPRAGCRPELLRTIARIAPKRLIYVSCDPATLSRDLKILTGEAGYSFVEATPVDMFPHTAHVEVVTLITRAGVETTELM